METTETPEFSQPPKQPEKLPEIILNADAKYFLYTAGRWAVFLGIMGFIFTGFIALMAIFAGAIFSTIGRLQGAAAMPAGVGGLITVVYLIFAAVHFFFALYLYQFGVKIKDGITYINELQVTIALGKLKSFFKYWGILVIVVISLYILIFIGAIIFAAAFKGNMPTDTNAYSFIY